VSTVAPGDRRVLRSHAVDINRYESMVVNAWAIGSLVCGPALIMLGARAAGLALLGSVLGAFAGLVTVANSYDAVPMGTLVGATLGVLALGLAGLAWRPSASRAFLRALAWIVGLLGSAASLAVAVLGRGDCPFIDRRRTPCLPTLGHVYPLVVAANAAFIVLLLALQASRADDPVRSGSAA
jgi:hypothetical protein